MGNTGERLTVRRQCPFCPTVQEVTVFKADYDEWRKGKLAQNAFPYLSASKREILISGMCDDCFPKDED